MKVINRMKDVFDGQKTIMLNAVLPISNDKPQHLLLGKVCYALEQCYGTKTAQIIMMHFWELIYHSQRSYRGIYDSLEGEFKTSTNKLTANSFGYFEKFKYQMESFDRRL